jgi:hypothetical protein
MNEKFLGGKEQYIMFDLKVLHPDIWYWDNAISYPDELVHFINDIDSDRSSHKAISPWFPWLASNDKNIVYGSTKNLTKNEVLIGSGNEKTDQKVLYIYNSLEMAFLMCYDRYMEAHKIIDKSQYKIYTDSINVKKWQPGANMGPHADGYDGNTDLAFSLVAYLNDDYEGGEISFPNHNITVKPKKGSLIMFPAQEPFVHEVKQVISGDRYMSTVSSWKV